MDQRLLIKAINHRYPLKIVAATLLRESADNSVWLLRSSNRHRYVARLSKRAGAHEIAFEAAWIDWLHAAGVPVAPTVATRDRQPATTFGHGQTATVFTHINGHHLANDPGTPPPLPAVASAATALAHLHNASRQHTVALPRRRTILTELERAMANASAIRTTLPGGEEFLAHVTKAHRWGSAPSSPPVLLHNDYRIGNLLFAGNRVAAILDFDWCCIGPAVKDVAQALAEWSFPDGATAHWEEVFAAFLGRYNDAASEPVLRDRTLVRWIAFSCLSDAATYLLDRLARGEVHAVNDSYQYRKFLYFSRRAL